VVKDLEEDTAKGSQAVVNAVEQKLGHVQLRQAERHELGESALAGRLSKKLIAVIGMLVGEELKAALVKQQPIVVSTQIQGDRTYQDLRRSDAKVKQTKAEVRKLSDKLGLANYKLHKALKFCKQKGLNAQKKHASAHGAIKAENLKLVKSTVKLEGRMLQCQKQLNKAQEKQLAQSNQITKHSQEMTEARAEISLNKKMTKESMALKLKLKSGKKDLKQVTDTKNAKEAAMQKTEQEAETLIVNLKKQLALEKKLRSAAEQEAVLLKKAMENSKGKLAKHATQNDKVQAATAKCQATLQHFQKKVCRQALTAKPVDQKLGLQSVVLAGRLQATLKTITRLYTALGGGAPTKADQSSKKRLSKVVATAIKPKEKNKKKGRDLTADDHYVRSAAGKKQIRNWIKQTVNNNKIGAERFMRKERTESSQEEAGLLGEDTQTVDETTKPAFEIPFVYEDFTSSKSVGGSPADLGATRRKLLFSADDLDGDVSEMALGESAHAMQGITKAALKALIDQSSQDFLKAENIKTQFAQLEAGLVGLTQSACSGVKAITQAKIETKVAKKVKKASAKNVAVTKDIMKSLTDDRVVKAAGGEGRIQGLIAGAIKAKRNGKLGAWEKGGAGGKAGL